MFECTKYYPPPRLGQSPLELGSVGVLLSDVDSKDVVL